MQAKPMLLSEDSNDSLEARVIFAIKSIVDTGKAVHWSADRYRVERDDLGDYRIRDVIGGTHIGLTSDDQDTELSGHIGSFYTRDERGEKHKVLSSCLCPIGRGVTGF